MLTETLLRAQERQTDHRGSEHTDQPQGLLHQISKTSSMDYEPFEVIDEDTEEGMQ